MKNLKNFSNRFLLEKTKSLVAEERRMTTEVLWHLAEIRHRRLYAEMGFSSLFEYAVKELQYSEAAAGRRIAAMKLLTDIPEIEPALKNGAVHLSTLSTIQYFVQRSTTSVSREEKKELVLSLKGKSRRECEKELFARAPAFGISMPMTPFSEREKVVAPTLTEIKFLADDGLMEKLKRIRELDAHVTAGASNLELFHRLADLALKKLDPFNSKKARKEIQVHRAQESAENLESPAEIPATPPAEYNLLPPMIKEPSEKSTRQKRTNASRKIPTDLKRKVWIRDQGKCTYMGTNGRKCESRFGLEIDHRRPIAAGGSADLQNLRLLCKSHNIQEAIAKLGTDVMPQKAAIAPAFDEIFQDLRQSWGDR